MKIDSDKLYEFNTPLIFSDGTETFNKLKKEYLTHDSGLFILAPSGAGKTYYINNQKEKNWIDGDELWMSAHAHPKFGWWNESENFINQVEAQSDIITLQAKKLGFWILGSANNWLKPDAIVLPHWSTHKKYVKCREQNNYDGGATIDKFDQLLRHRKIISQWTKKGVPKFTCIEDAVEYFNSKGGIK